MADTSRGPGKPPGAAFRTRWDDGREEQWGAMLQLLEVGAWQSLEGDAEAPCLISSALTPWEVFYVLF